METKLMNVIYPYALTPPVILFTRMFSFYGSYRNKLAILLTKVEARYFVRAS